MAVGLDQDTEGAYRASIPSGGAGTLTDGAFANFFVGVWVYRPSSTATYANTAGGAIIDLQGGARLISLGFNSVGGTLADIDLQATLNSDGSGVQLFATHAGNDYLDEWVYYFILENSTSGHIAGYILLSDLASVADSITRANDNAGSQYANTLTFGNVAALSACVLGHYAYGRAVYGTGLTTTDALAYAASSAPDAGDWGFWPLADNADTGDDSGNSRTLTFAGTLTSESDPSLGPPAVNNAVYYLRA